MKHATEESLTRIRGFLDQVRTVPGLKETKPGVFYRKSRAFLHFHEDPAGLFADVRLSGTDFARFPVTTRAQQRAVLAAIRKAVES